MKLVTGFLLGLVGYSAWRLSEPAPGQPSNLSTRVELLKNEWERARAKGKEAGAARRTQMEREFDSLLKP